ncbi:MAG: hypothetical protein ACOVNU_14745 [Candidatus Kapaibacteriota bacterium]|jgi:hypothetical protein
MQIFVDGGSTKVYTGPKKGKFYINKHGKKVYLNRAMLNDEVPYKNNKPAAKANKPGKAKKMAEASVIMNE